MPEPIRITRMATRKELIANNGAYSGFDPYTGVLFFNEPGYEPKFYFNHNGLKYTLFRAKGSRITGEYEGNHNGQVSLVRIEREGFSLYQIVSGEKPFFLENRKRILPSGKTQVYGIYYFLSSRILIHFWSKERELGGVRSTPPKTTIKNYFFPLKIL